jgi:anti-sigma factor RsiW
MPELPPIDNENEEEETLVAYLDGELDPQSEDAVETRLSLDVRVRSKVDALRRTWELLDYLPRPEPSPRFTSQTLDRISALRPAAVVPRSSPWPGLRWRLWAFGLIWLALILLAGTLGFTAIRYLLEKPRHGNLDELLVRYVWVIENEQLYKQVDDIGFLKQLAVPELFGDER